MSGELVCEPIAEPAAGAVPFEIVDAGDGRVASNGRATLQIQLAEGGRLFRRRAVKLNGPTGVQTRVEWAVAELDGVRVYFDGTNVVVTRRDLNP